MRLTPATLAILFAAVAASQLTGFARTPMGQAFTSPGDMTDASGSGSLLPAVSAPAQSDTSKLCAEGTRAIDQGRWADAVKAFSQVAAQHAEHADAALYWKAYAESKLGQSVATSESCKQLRQNFPKSKWVEDCGALEVEIGARSGKPVEIDPNASDDVKLLALNTMLRQDEPRALAEIQSILKGDSSDKLKKEVQFILGTHYSDSTYAQAVRISFVQGDVRIQRGDPNSKVGNAPWEQAVSDMPVETGFSLVTGQGRAEIEFENASTIYLGENSILTFNDLHETAGVPYTELGLLSGTLSLYFRPYVAWEKLVVHTPTNDFVARYPDKAYARVESFTDAVSITPLEGGTVHLPGVERDAAVPGRTFTWLQGQLVDPAGTPADMEFAAWDKWVADRITDRNATVAAVMAQAGLSAPIPGLADMAGRGSFFECAPYGTCWEPKEAAKPDATAMLRSQSPEPSARVSAQPHLQLTAYHSPAGGSMQAQFDATTPQETLDGGFSFPCTPSSLLFHLTKDPLTGRTVVSRWPFMQAEPYDWAVCHAGSWIRHRKHYVWVVGIKRHHIDPVRWVRVGKTVAFVPLHPYDVKGQPAVNAHHEVFAVIGKNPPTIEPVRFDNGAPIQYLKDPPREYRTAYLRPLKVADAPRMEARVYSRVPAAGGTKLARVTVPVHFDLKSQTFLMAREVVHGGKPATVFAPITNRTGSLQARGEAFGGAVSYHGLTSSSGSGFRGGGSVGSASRGGGGGVSSSGGAHAGGGSTVSSSSVSSSSSAATSSSGSHH